MANQWQDKDSARGMVKKYNKAMDEVQDLVRQLTTVSATLRSLGIEVKDLTPADIGLGNVDNTSDADKPVSRAQEEAIIAATEPMITSERAALIYEMPEYRRVTKEDVGLDQVDNTPDMDKPVSAAMVIAITQAIREAKLYTDDGLARLINGAPDTLNTLREIAETMKADEHIVKVLSEAVGTKAAQVDLLEHTEDLNNPHHVTKKQLGLDNVRNVEQIPQANLTASTEISEGGVYAMDAVQANPEVVGSLANKIRMLATIVSGSEDELISSDNISYDHSLSTIPHNLVRRAIDELCYRIEGYQSKHSVFNDDGSITETIPYIEGMFGEKVTQFKDDGSIVETFSMIEKDTAGNETSRTIMKIKTTSFGDTGITETVNDLVDYGPVSS